MIKGRNIKNFVKSQLFFDVHQYWTFLIDLQAEVSRFRCRFFSCFAYFLKLQHDYHQFLILYKLSSVIVLHLEPFENNFFELDFSIFKKVRFYCQTF